MKSGQSEKSDIYQAITDQILTAIEAGTGPVRMPWHQSGGAITRPLNVESGKAYQGINTLALWAGALNGGFATGLWGTYRQWQARGAQVRKGEKASPIVFYKECPSGDDEAPDRAGRRILARASHVFNVAQVDGYAILQPDPSAMPIDPVEAADRFIRATGAVIEEGGEDAFYRPSTDTITMPDRFRFTGTRTSTATEAWYGVLLHECIHWSGAARRLDRVFGERFGDDAYAMEELVAELGAAFLCGDLGISAEPRPDHSAYISHWLQIMKGDRKAVFAAASAARRACDYLAGLQDREGGP